MKKLLTTMFVALLMVGCGGKKLLKSLRRMNPPLSP